MLSYPITEEQLATIAIALSTGEDKEKALKNVQTILDVIGKADIEKTVGTITSDGIIIKDNIMDILEDKKWTMGDIPETLTIAKAIKRMIGNIAEMKAELKDIDINEITILLCSTLQEINEQVK